MWSKNYITQRETDNPQLELETSNTPLLATDRIIRQKISKEMKELKTINHQVLIAIFRKLHPTTAVYTFSFQVPMEQSLSLAIKQVSGLPWWRSGWESACQCRGHGFEPWSGKIPHAAEQLDPWATTTEPARLELVLRNKRGRDSERPVHHDEEWPPLAATRESPRTETKTQHSQK